MFTLWMFLSFSLSQSTLPQRGEVEGWEAGVYLLHWDLCYGIGEDQLLFRLVLYWSGVFWSFSELYLYLPCFVLFEAASIYSQQSH